MTRFHEATNGNQKQNSGKFLMCHTFSDIVKYEEHLIRGYIPLTSVLICIINLNLYTFLFLVLTMAVRVVTTGL